MGKKGTKIKEDHINHDMQYFSKWENKWVDFITPPSDGEIIEMKKKHYQIRKKH